MRDLGGVTERGLRLVAVEQVPLHVQHRAGGDRLLVEVVDAQQRRHAEVGVHRALGVGGDHDDAPAGRRFAVGATGTELHADRADVVAEHVAEIVVVDLADVGGAAAEAGDAAHRVRRRPAAHLDRAAERRVELDGPIGLDQRHRPLDQVVGVEELVVRVGDHVDERVADPDHVEAASTGRVDPGIDPGAGSRIGSGGRRPVSQAAARARRTTLSGRTLRCPR